MPLFEYVCTKCQHGCELLVRGQDRPRCPECGSTALEKQFSVPAAHTKGTSSLPMAAEPGGMCGRPQCGQGGCQGF